MRASIGEIEKAIATRGDRLRLPPRAAWCRSPVRRASCCGHRTRSRTPAGGATPMTTYACSDRERDARRWRGCRTRWERRTHRTAHGSTRPSSSADWPWRSSVGASRSTSSPGSSRSRPAWCGPRRRRCGPSTWSAPPRATPPRIPGQRRAVAPIYSLVVATEPIAGQPLGRGRSRGRPDVHRPATPDHLRPAHGRRTDRLRRSRGAVPLRVVDLPRPRPQGTRVRQPADDAHRLVPCPA